MVQCNSVPPIILVTDASEEGIGIKLEADICHFGIDWYWLLGYYRLINTDDNCYHYDHRINILLKELGI